LAHANLLAVVKRGLTEREACLPYRAMIHSTPRNYSHVFVWNAVCWNGYWMKLKAVFELMSLSVSCRYDSEGHSLLTQQLLEEVLETLHNHGVCSISVDAPGRDSYCGSSPYAA